MADQIPVLHIFTLGPPKVRLGKHLLSFPTCKMLALLIYLAINVGLQPREHLAALLWLESSPEHSHASLRHTLAHQQTIFRRSVGHSLF